MRLVYISGQYRANTIYGIVENVRKAEVVALKYWRKGCAVICPHKNTALLDGAIEDVDAQVWLEGDLEMLRRCDIIVMMQGWEESEGATKELQFAIQHGMEVVYE